MRRLSLADVAFLGQAGASVPLGLVSYVAATGSNSITAPINTTGATLIVFSVSFSQQFNPTTVSDNKGNVYTLRPGTGNFDFNRVYYCLNPVVGTNHIFTYLQNSSQASIAIEAFNWGPTPTLDVHSGAGDSFSGTSGQPGSITPSVSGALLITTLGIFNGTSVVAPPGYSLTSHVATGGGNWGITMGYRVQAVAASENPTWSWTTSNPWWVNIVAFKM